VPLAVGRNAPCRGFKCLSPWVAMLLAFGCAAPFFGLQRSTRRVASCDAPRLGLRRSTLWVTTLHAVGGSAPHFKVRCPTFGVALRSALGSQSLTLWMGCLPVGDTLGCLTMGDVLDGLFDHEKTHWAVWPWETRRVT